jgi:hypothetical protein
MSITSWPADTNPETQFTCVICGRTRDIKDATAGPRDTGGFQQLACNRHFLNDAKFLTDWAPIVYPHLGAADHVTTLDNPKFLYAEQRAQRGIRPLAWDLARHIFTRQSEGLSVVISSTPEALRSEVEHHWSVLRQKAVVDRKDISDARQMLALTHAIINLHTMRFSVDESYRNKEHVALFGSIDEIHLWAPVCQTLYVTEPIAPTVQSTIEQAMPRHALVVTYA